MGSPGIFLLMPGGATRYLKSNTGFRGHRECGLVDHAVLGARAEAGQVCCEKAIIPSPQCW
jgi:hypothetical protein